jgi:Ca2+-binding RTX toxin-like protein
MRRAILLAVVALTMMVVPTVAVDAGTPRCLGERATIVGTNRSEVIRGTARADVIVGLGGADTIFGRGGNDVICGGGGNDRIVAGASSSRATTSGFEALLGEAGNDALLGGGGFDVLLGGPGDDLIDGGDGGSDVPTYFRSRTAVVVDLAAGTATGEGSDTLRNVEWIEGSEFDDMLTGDSNRNRFTGLGGNDDLNGRGGFDVVQYIFARNPVTIDLSVGTASGEGSDSLVSIEQADGSRFGDTIVGDAGDNVLFGLRGDDSLDGGDGTDHLEGGPGTDTCMNGETVSTCEA